MLSASATVNPCVAVVSLSLSAFRSYKHARISLEVSKPLVVLVGANGVGKTNVLEAISYLAPGRGMRSAALADVTAKNGDHLPQNDQSALDSWAVSAVLDLGKEQIRVGTGLEKTLMGEPQSPRRIVRIEGENQPNSNSLGQRWSVSWLTPQMDRLFLEGPSGRRKFLDRLVVGLYPDHSRQISAYERVMRERNKLLTEHGSSADSAWLKALEARMAEHAVAAAIHRTDFAGQLAGQMQSVDEHHQENLFPAADIAIDGWLEQLINCGTKAVDAEEAFRDRLKSERVVDAGAGRTTTGIHKTDLLVSHQSKNMPAELCSTGEQKALLIGLIIANARLIAAQRGAAPILLLDEITAHLDDKRRQALFNILRTLGSQCWLTGTDKNLFDDLEGHATFLEIKDGRLKELTEKIGN